ncbi:MAG: peptidylprolyl isomerase [Nitrospinaceae bacterium]
MQKLAPLFPILILAASWVSGPAWAEDIAVLETVHGTIEISFFPDKAPNHVKNFKKLAQSGFYDGTAFHRVIPGFMIQGGDPNSKKSDRSLHGIGGPGYTIDAEFNDIPHSRGIVSMARSRNPNSAGSQFFIVVKDANFLDGKYTVFGKVIKGMDVADKIVNEKRDSRDNPLNPMTLKSVKIIERASAAAVEEKSSAEPSPEPNH